MKVLALGTIRHVAQAYCENRFCASLDEDDRAALCPLCTLSRYEQGSQISNDMFHRNVMLIIEGVLGTIKTTSGKLQYVYTPCDIFAHEYLFNDSPIKYEGYGLMQALRPLTVAFFPVRKLRRLFVERPGIARALYVNLSTLYNNKCFYRLMVEMDDPRHAVQYMLLYLQQKGIEPPPTHEELAFMTGHNRVTVTRAFKEICRSGLHEKLFDYMQATLNGAD